MVKVIQDDLWFCTDCYMLEMTGDTSSFDYYYGDGQKADVRIREIENELKRFDGHIVADNDAETGEGIEEFSRRYCDCCNTNLAGARYRMAVLGK